MDRRKLYLFVLLYVLVFSISFAYLLKLAETTVITEQTIIIPLIFVTCYVIFGLIIFSCAYKCIAQKMAEKQK